MQRAAKASQIQPIRDHGFSLWLGTSAQMSRSGLPRSQGAAGRSGARQPGGFGPTKAARRQTRLCGTDLCSRLNAAPPSRVLDPHRARRMFVARGFSPALVQSSSVAEIRVATDDRVRAASTPGRVGQSSNRRWRSPAALIEVRHPRHTPACARRADARLWAPRACWSSQAGTRWAWSETTAISRKQKRCGCWQRCPASRFGIVDVR